MVAMSPHLSRRHFLFQAAVAAAASALPLKNAKPLRGIFIIMATPFTEAGAVDFEDLENEVRWLDRCGVRIAVEGDDLVVEGADNFPAGGAMIESQLDHRIAMAFLVLGLAANEPVRIDDAAPIATSFPGFIGLINGLGGAIAEDG